MPCLTYHSLTFFVQPDVTVTKLSRFTGECYMKQGEGPGAFGSWKKFFVVERDDHGFDLFPDEKVAHCFEF